MDIEDRIRLVEEDLVDLRSQWKSASIPMKKIIEEKGKKKQGEIKVLRNVLRRREKRPEAEMQQKLI